MRVITLPPPGAGAGAFDERQKRAARDVTGMMSACAYGARRRDSRRTVARVMAEREYAQRADSGAQRDMRCALRMPRSALILRCLLAVARLPAR